MGQIAIFWISVKTLDKLINPRHVGGLGYSSLSVCLCVCVSVCMSVVQFGLPGDLGITIILYVGKLVVRLIKFGRFCKEVFVSQKRRAKPKKLFTYY